MDTCCASGEQGLQFGSAASSAGPGIQKSLNKHLQIESDPLLPRHVAFAGDLVSLCFTVLHCKMGVTAQSWLQVVMRILRETDPEGAPPTGIPRPCPFKPPLSLQLAQDWDFLEPAQLKEGGLATRMECGGGQRRGCALQHPGEGLGLRGAAHFSLLPC